MADTIAITGIVATMPHPITTGDDLKITSFRLASAQRRFDKGRDRWVDGETNWYTVTAFRQLATNVASSVVKGDRVVVTGRLRIRDWANGEKSGTNVDVEADSVGHDLAWGTTSFTRVTSSSRTDADNPAGASGARPGSGDDVFPTGGGFGNSDLAGAGFAGAGLAVGEQSDGDPSADSSADSSAGLSAGLSADEIDDPDDAREPLFGTADATAPF